MQKTQEEIENFYDDFVEKQKKISINKRHYSILDILEKTNLSSHYNVLEIGCGIGTFTTLLSTKIVEGQIVAMDISGESIKYAQETIKRTNLKFIHADATNFDFGNQKFDVIVMPDVIEHIPIELHKKLFESLSRVLNINGYIMIHIPNPYYLQWCHENRPDLLQVIDQPITTDILIQNTYPNGLFIDALKTYPIWINDNDYQYVILRKKGYQDFSKTIEYKPTFWDKVDYKLKSWFKKN
jgi:ubiquinone/menaquinone biosynthesis C-methylase UbiE